MVKDEYKIAYLKNNLPDSPSELLKLKTKSGKIFINKSGVKIEGNGENFEFGYSNSVSCEYKRRQLFGFIVLKSKNYAVNVMITRINLFNWFLTTNFFATINLYRFLKDKFKKK